MVTRLFTSESVTEGHPDKMCDIISDTVLDKVLEQDKNARVAVECLVKDTTVIVAGELTTIAPTYGITEEILYTIRDIGYDARKFSIHMHLSKQSPDIAQGVDTGGAGDQGSVFGYACDETSSLMPAPIYYAHKLAKRLAAVRKQELVVFDGKPFLKPDGKTQVTFRYEDDKPVSVDTIVVSTQHTDAVSQRDVHHAVTNLVINSVIPKELMDRNTKIYINPTGRFVIGGPEGDCGLTGRKIIVDTYGGMGRHGGGAFSGKDPSKVDRSAAYYARWIAKNIVRKGLAKRCEIQISYAIGIASPVGVYVNTFGTAQTSDESIERLVMDTYDMRPNSIIEQLKLLQPIYKETAAYGHFGRDTFPWEKV